MKESKVEGGEDEHNIYKEKLFITLASYKAYMDGQT